MEDEIPPLIVGDYVAIAVVLLISLSIGIYFKFSGGKQKTTQEYLMAGKSMPIFPVVFSLVVTFVSAIIMLGAPAEVYEYGLDRMTAYITSAFGNVVAAYIFLPVYFQMGASVSVYEYLERRFGRKTRTVTSALFILQTMFYISIVLYAPALALSVVTGIPEHTSVIIIGSVCTIYCTMGGLKAVLWTDVFQAIIMYICIFAVFIKGILEVGGVENVYNIAYENNRLSHLDFTLEPKVRYSLWNCLAYGMITGLFNYGCNQSQVQRMLCVKNLKQSQRAVLMSVPLAVIFIIINFLVGVVMVANFYNCDPLSTSKMIEKRDQMVPYFIATRFHDYPGLVGVCVAGIFSGSLSSISSAVNSLSAVTMVDFVQPYFSSSQMTDKRASLLAKFIGTWNVRTLHRDYSLDVLTQEFQRYNLDILGLQETRWTGKAFSYGLLGIGMAFAISNFKTIVEAHTVIYGVMAGPILGLFVLGMMTVSGNQKGALSGLLSGFVFAFSLAIDFITNKKSPQNESSNSTKIQCPHIIPLADKGSSSIRLSFMWFAVVGFSTSFLIGYIVSYATRNKKTANVEPVLLSPLARKYLIKSIPQTEEQENELEKL